MRYLGILIVLGCVLGGFAAEGGPLPVLFQPVEVLIILGAVAGGLLISFLPHQLREMGQRAFSVFNGTRFDRALAQEYLSCLFQLSIMVKREGVIALENHLAEPEESDIFSNYPLLLQHRPVLEFLLGSLRLQVDGAVTPEELDSILEREMECQESENDAYTSVFQRVSDSLPGLGIVAAVLGIIIAMTQLGGPREQIGHHVAVALVGTFLGVLLSYGFAQPLVNAMEQESDDSHNFFSAIRVGMVAFSEGKAPVVVVEMSRRTIFSYNRPSREEIDEACRSLRAA